MPLILTSQIEPHDEPEQEPQDPAACADLTEADDEEEVSADFTGFDVGDNDVPDPNAASSSGAAPASLAAGALLAGVTEEDAEEDAAAGAMIRKHEVSGRA